MFIVNENCAPPATLVKPLNEEPPKVYVALKSEEIAMAGEKLSATVMLQEMGVLTRTTVLAATHERNDAVVGIP